MQRPAAEVDSMEPQHPAMSRPWPIILKSLRSVRSEP